LRGPGVPPAARGRPGARRAPGDDAGSRSREWSWPGVVGFVALTVFTGWALWAALHVDADVAEALAAAPYMADEASRYPPRTYVAATTSTAMWALVVLHHRDVVRWPSGAVLAIIAAAHSTLAAVAIVSVASLTA
jgi:hypothetical protein